MTCSHEVDEPASNNPFASLQYDSSGDNADGVDATSHHVVTETANLRGGGDAEVDAQPEIKALRSRKKKKPTQEQRDRLYDWKMAEGEQEAQADATTMGTQRGRGGRAFRQSRGYHQARGGYQSHNSRQPLRPGVTVVDIYFESMQDFNGEPAVIIESFFRRRPLAALKAGSKFVSDRLQRVPESLQTGRRLVANLYIPTDGLNVGALKAMLHHIDAADLPLQDNGDPLHVPQFDIWTDEVGMSPIKGAVDLYQIYLFLGMQDGQLSHQQKIVDAIIRRFADEANFSKEDVMYYWRRCKDDEVLTGKVLRLVVGCALRCGKDLMNSMALYFEQDVELKALWDETAAAMRKRRKEREQREQEQKRERKYLSGERGRGNQCQS